MNNIEAGKSVNLFPAAGDSPLKKFSKIVPFIIIGTACFCVYYLLTKNTPPFFDDLYLKFVYQGWDIDKIKPPRVTNISQIFEGMALYYKTFRGRVIAEGLAQLFAVYGKQYFNIGNSFVFTGITSLVYFHSNNGKKANWLLYLIICVAFWFLTPDLMSTSLWMVSSLCEFWPIFIVLLFLVPYRILFSESGEIKHPVITTQFIIPIGFLAGAFNEQSFGLSIGFSILAVIFVKIKRRKVPIWSIIGLLSTLCGTLFVLLAPGNTFQYGNPLHLYLKNFPDNVIRTVVMSFEVTKVLLLFTIIVIVWLNIDIRKTTKVSSNVKKKGNQTEHKFSFKSIVDNRNGILMPVMFLIIAVGSVGIATALPYVEYRLFFTVFVSFALVFFSLLSEAVGRIENSGGKLKNLFANKCLRIAVPVLIIFITILDFGSQFRVYHQDFIVYTDFVNSIEEKIASGERNIVLPKKTEIEAQLLRGGRLRGFIFYWATLSDDQLFFDYKWYAYSLGADTIITAESTVPQEEASR